MTTAYRTHPVHLFPWLDLQQGYGALAARINAAAAATNGTLRVAIDGFSGVRWDRLVAQLAAALDACPGPTLPLTVLPTEDLFPDESDLAETLRPALTDDPVFGRLFHGHLSELWDPARVAARRARIGRARGLVLVVGPGAAGLVEPDLLMYVDMPKDVGQALARDGAVCPLGARTVAPFNLTYKRLFFVDWPVLNREKRRLLPHIDLYIDGAALDAPTFAPGNEFRRALHELSQQPFRVKPWFAPGPWGGQWMKERFGLPPDQPNYAWSFELIAPENGVLLGSGDRVLECSFDLLLWQETDAVLGARVAARYGSLFPIRFDYLDTMGGTNLSCQVHPRVDAIREEFGEPFTQDESYYIVANEPGARVFLGLRDDADVGAFHRAATAARDEHRPFDIADHVHSRPSRPGDLFLIPSGTVHCSGKDNLVLEISATPYIYTMKIYDYLRTDLGGNLRHVHLDHAFAALDPARRASWVDERLTPPPRLLRQGDGWSEYAIGESDLLFYAVNRLEFTEGIDDTLPAAFVVLNLVEGERCDILAPGCPPLELRFAETLIVPASVGRYTLRNRGEGVCKVVKAFVK